MIKKLPTVKVVPKSSPSPEEGYLFHMIFFFWGGGLMIVKGTFNLDQPLKMKNFFKILTVHEVNLHVHVKVKAEFI